MNDEILTLAGWTDTSPSATDAARAERDKLILLAGAVLTVDSPEAAQFVANVLRSLTGFTQQIEGAREEVKAPVLDLGRRIDALAKELVLDLKYEASRLGKILGAWQAEQRRREEETQRKAREEEQRIWAEAKAKERAEQDRIAKEEQERQAKHQAELAELEAKAARARSESGKAKAEAEAAAAKLRADFEADLRAQQQERESERRIQEAQDAMVQARIAGNQVVARKPVGVATREEICYEITDMTALYEAAPFLVTMTENKSALKAALKGLQPGQSLPGVKHWLESKTHVRA